MRGVVKTREEFTVVKDAIDSNLRQIYGVCLQATGYDTVRWTGRRQPTPSIEVLSGKPMKKITVNSYRQDKYYPSVVRAFAGLLSRSDVISPVEVLLEMGRLSRKDHEAWRRGQVPYLERVFAGNLSHANRILRIIGFHAHDLNMVPRHTVYHQWGSGKNRILRFTKSGDRNIENAYCRHYLWNRSQEKKPGPEGAGRAEDGAGDSAGLAEGEIR